MNFLSGILDFGKSILGFLGGNSIGADLAKTAALGLLLNKLTDSVNRDNETTSASTTNEPDPGVRLQVTPDTEHRIPVVYGSAFLGGIITDARISNSNRTMHYVITICEKTGAKISDDLESEFTFENIYLDDQRVVFQSDGITVDYTVDRDGVVDYSYQNQAKIYCYKHGSLHQTAPAGYTITPVVAYSLVPGWTSDWSMADLVFAVVRIDYNRDKGVTELPDVTFHMRNSMFLPGDCLYDYMTNTRYGAGIDQSEIYVE